ncbi:MAG TPA: DMT family transporter, partial [Thermoanaerobaculia bacterium]
MRIPPRAGALIAVVFWGISFVATKVVLREISFVTLIFFRFGVAAVLLNLVVRRMPPKDSWRPLALMGFIGVFVHQMVQAYALTLTSATHAGWLIGLTPVWSAILAAIVLRERFGLWKIVGLTGGFAGALLVITRGNFSSSVLTLPSTRGDLLIFASTLNWAVYSVVGHPTIRRLGPRLATAGMMTFGALMLAPFFIFMRGWRDIPHLSTIGWIAILFLSIGCSAFGYLVWYGALEHVEVSRVAALLYLEPFVTFAAAIVLLREPISGIAIAGGLLVIVSVMVMQYAPR